MKYPRIFITASSSGIGEGVAIEFLNLEGDVMINGRSPEKLSRAAAALTEKFSRRVETFAGDLTDPGVIALLPQTLEKTWGALDVLVLNLGSGRSLPGFEADEGEWQRVLSTNLTSAMSTLRACIPLLEKGEHPAVIFIGSIAGMEALGAPLAYGAAKAGLEHSMRASSRLLASKGIRVNMVSPGNIFTSGGTWDQKLQKDRAGVEAMLESSVPMKRLGTPQEVAAAVVFLSSPQASFITGANLRVDGGQCRS